MLTTEYNRIAEETRARYAGIRAYALRTEFSIIDGERLKVSRDDPADYKSVEHLEPVVATLRQMIKEAEVRE